VTAGSGSKVYAARLRIRQLEKDSVLTCLRTVRDGQGDFGRNEVAS
jgi:hypothetical protein